MVVIGAHHARRLAASVACLLLLALAGCGDPANTEPPDRADGTPTSSSTRAGDPAPTEATVADPEHAVDPPPPLKGALRYADILVYSRDALPDDVVQRIDDLPRVVATEQMSMAQVSVENRVIAVAAVDPATYRRFTPAGSAQLEDIWTRVAGGEMAIPAQLGKQLQQKDAFIQLGNDKSAPTVHIGAYAEQIPRVDAVVNERWGEEFGMIDGNALIVATGINSPQSVKEKIQKIVGPAGSVQILGPDLDIKARQTAFLTGGSVADAVGSFSYRVIGGGRIAPDPAWVAANIRTEQVPILGSVTCHKVMLPQLRAALREVVEANLAHAIHPGEYAGCYYPRFIAGSSSLSLHSFGIALDLNVPGNQRGTSGEMNRAVVQIFKRWGFAWGGDWNYTDPMHFEMNALVEAR